MTQVLEAVYEHGTFRLVTQPIPPLEEGQQVRISVEVDTPEDILGPAARVYEGLSEQEVNDNA